MAKKTKSKAKSTSRPRSKSTASTSSWWKERSKILAQRTESRPAKAKSKKVKTKRAAKTEAGRTYYCDVCGCEMVCVEPSEEAVVCCDEPMLLVIE